MRRTTILACSSCQNMHHCAECSSYLNSPIAFKANVSKKLAKSNTYKRTPGITEALSVNNYSVCTNCDSKNCFACTIYNTRFINEG